MGGQLSYRADVDGLRGIAVVCVILFHLGFEAFAGGFVGVDVFFVISGFLITRMIRAQVATADSASPISTSGARGGCSPPCSRPSWRRSGPPICFLAQTSSDSGSVLQTLFAAANFYFWSESGYFDAEAAMKPLLHTWSLAVEEQFYLVWPALLVLLLRRASRLVLPFILAAGALSLYLGERWLGSDEAAAFYLLPPRVVELAMGAAMVWLVERQPRNKLLLEPMVWAGMALIGLSVFSYTGATAFPGLSALVPCVGTALLLYSGEARYSGWIFRNRLAVAVGLISYSLYLIHWPVLVFYRYYRLDELTPFETGALVVVSFVAAALMYRFIENPIRHGIRKEKHLAPAHFGLVCLVLTVLVALPAAHAWARGGWSWRLPSEIRATAQDLDERRLMTWQYVEGEAAGRAFGRQRTNVLVTGDSHAKDLFNALFLNAERFAKFEFRHLALDGECYYLFADSPQPGNLKRGEQRQCEEAVSAFESSPLVDDADYVLVSTRWRAWSIPHVDSFHRYLASRGPQLVLLGRTAEFANVPDLVVRFGRLHGVDRYVTSTRKKRLDAISARVEQKAVQLDIRYLDKLAFLCSTDRRSCDVLDDNDNLLFFDYGHWTLEGARHFGSKMAAIGFLDGL